MKRERVGMNVVMLSLDRPRLLRQPVESLTCTTPHLCSLTIVDDGSTDPETLRYLEELEEGALSIQVLRNSAPLGVGGSRNKGARESEARFGRGEWLCFLDNDVVLKAGWFDVLTTALHCFPQ